MAARKKGKRRTASRASTKRASTRRASPRQTAVKRASDKFDLVETGHKVWLAGLGAMARAQSEGPKLFEALVEEGAIVQERARETTEQFFSKAVAEVRGAADERMEALRGTANETWDNVEKIFQSRVQKALQQIGMPTSHEIRALTRKVDDLTRSVEGLSAKPRRAGVGRTTSSEAASSAAV